MLQDASIMPATKSKKEVRALGAMERLFWLMDQKHPAHLTVTAEVKGITKVQSWRDALDAVQRRHLDSGTWVFSQCYETGLRYPVAARS